MMRRPARAANATASKRECNPNFPRMFWTCVLAVSGLIVSARAMRRLSAPSVTSSKTSRSRAGQSGQSADDLILVSPSIDQSMQQRTEHSGRHQGFAAGHRSRCVDELVEAILLRQIPVRPSFEGGNEYVEVLSHGQDEDRAFGKGLAYHPRRLTDIQRRYLSTQDRHSRPRPPDLGDRLQPIARLGNHLQVGTRVENDLHRFAEQGVLVGEEHADSCRPCAQENSQPQRPGYEEHSPET